MSSRRPSPEFWEHAVRLLEDARDLRALSDALLRIQRTLLDVEPAVSAVHLTVAPGTQVTHALTSDYRPGAPGTRMVIPFSQGEVEIRLPGDPAAVPVTARHCQRLGPLLGVVSERLRRLILAEGGAELSLRPPADLPATGPFARLVGRSVAMRDLRERLAAVGRRPSDVLLVGESGTGKELAADALHRVWGREGPLVAVNCGALAGDMAQSRLFGHEKGAFTGAERSRPGAFREAHGGTLFLDEVNSLAPPVQAYLLRALESRSIVPVGADRPEVVDVRVISATNGSLRSAVTDETFRPDLLARIETVTISLPPLRDRTEDIPELAARFLLRYSREHRLPLFTLSPRANAILAAHSWPGNVRELFAVLTRAALHCDEERTVLRTHHVHDALHPETRSVPSRSAAPRPGEAVYDAHMKAFERALLERALDATGWNVSATAREMGMSRSRLRNRIRVLSLPGPHGRGDAS